MKLFGRYGSWWRHQYVLFIEVTARGSNFGSFFIGKLKTLFFGIIGMGGAEVVSLSWGGFSLADYFPWWIIFIVPIVDLLKDIIFGLLEWKVFKTWQAQIEIIPRLKINPWEDEKMERLKNIERKIAPETYQEEHKTYLYKDSPEYVKPEK